MRPRRRLHITLLTQGSRGDVQPYIGLGAALKASGCEVTLAVPDAFVDLVEKATLRAFPVAPDPRLVSAEAGQPRWLEPGVLRSALRLKSRAGKSAGLMATYSGYLAASEKADLVLYPAWAAPVAQAIGKALGMPTLAAYLAPIHPTHAFPSPFLPGLGFLGNRLSHVLALILMGAALQGIPGRWGRKVLEVDRIPTRFVPRPGQVCLYGYSRSLLPEPGDWPEGTMVTGPWWMERPRSWTPPPELVRFLDRDGPVVLLGFGSMKDPHPRQLNAIVMDALSRAGCRAILISGPEGQLDLGRSARWLSVKEIPLDWILPHVDAVVHHAGAGTTAEAARAGIPSVTVPYFGDQLFWAQRLHLAGAAPSPVKRRSLTAGRLARALAQSLENPQMRTNAAALGQRVRAEDGLAAAVRVVQESGLSR